MAVMGWLGWLGDAGGLAMDKRMEREREKERDVAPSYLGGSNTWPKINQGREEDSLEVAVVAVHN